MGNPSNVNIITTINEDANAYFGVNLYSHAGGAKALLEAISSAIRTFDRFEDQDFGYVIRPMIIAMATTDGGTSTGAGGGVAPFSVTGLSNAETKDGSDNTHSILAFNFPSKQVVLTHTSGAQTKFAYTPEGLNNMKRLVEDLVTSAG